MIDFLNDNAGAVTALATVALLLVTGWYAYTTWALLHEAKQSRLLAGEPRVVAYLRPHEVHSNIVQLLISNLSAAPAVRVTAKIDKTTGWPATFDLENSKILRDLAFVRPHEVMKLDLGFGPDLFNEEMGAVFQIRIDFAGLDERAYVFEDTLSVDSVLGPSWKIYGLDDVARRLKEISDTLQGLAGSKRIKVEIYDSGDREKEAAALEKQRDEWRRRAKLGQPNVSQG